MSELDATDEEDTSSTEQGLTTANVPFQIGYGEGEFASGYVPDTHYGIVDGMAGWVGTTTTTPFGSVRTPAFKTLAHDDSRTGHTFLEFTGNVASTTPAAGASCTLSATLMADGWVHVEGHDGFPWLGPIDASVDVHAGLRGYVNGVLQYQRWWNIKADETQSENRTTSFNKTYSLSSLPAMFAKPNDRIDLEIELDTTAWEHNSDGEAYAAMYKFGFYANTATNVIKLTCN